MQVCSKLTSPTIAIMSSENCILNSVIRKMTVQVGGLSTANQGNILLVFMDWINDPRLKKSFSGTTSSSKMVLEQIRGFSKLKKLQGNTVVDNLDSLLQHK